MVAMVELSEWHDAEGKYGSEGDEYLPWYRG